MKANLECNVDTYISPATVKKQIYEEIEEMNGDCDGILIPLQRAISLEMQVAISKGLVKQELKEKAQSMAAGSNLPETYQCTHSGCVFIVRNGSHLGSMLFYELFTANAFEMKCLPKVIE